CVRRRAAGFGLNPPATFVALRFTYRAAHRHHQGFWLRHSRLEWRIARRPTPGPWLIGDRGDPHLSTLRRPANDARGRSQPASAALVMARISPAIAGAAGRMGRELVRAIAASDDLALAGATERDGAKELGQDAGEIAMAGKLGVALTSEVATA